MGYSDYLIMVVYLCLVLYVGYRFRNKERSYKEFFQAGKSMGWVPIGLSIMVTAFSVINYMALPAEVLGNGLYVLISLPVFFIAAALVSKVWLPFFYKLNLHSVYEYFELRFNRKVRILASIVFIFWRFFWIATALYASGSLLSKVAGVRVEYVIILAGAVATIYTFLGGIRAVMWTDCLQFVVLFGGILAGLIMVTSYTGEINFLETLIAGGRLRPIVPFDPHFFSFDPHIRISFWSGLIGVTVAFLSRYGADQVVMQRYFTAKSLFAAQRGIWFNALTAVFSLCMLIAFGLVIYLSGIENGSLDGVDFASLSVVQRKQIAMREFIRVMKSFPVGVTGLVVSGLLAATMSSVDSGINACLNSYLSDIQNNPMATGRAVGNVNRHGILVIGIICTGLALIFMPLMGASQSLFMIVNKVINALGSPLLAMFCAAMFCRRVNSLGALYGAVFGFVFSSASSFLVKGLALHYYGVLGFALTFMLIYIISIIAGMCGYKEQGREEYLYKRLYS